MKTPNFSEVIAMKENMTVLKNMIPPAWYKVLEELFEDWETMYPIYYSFQTLNRALKE
jgi:hypothetical protein